MKFELFKQLPFHYPKIVSLEDIKQNETIDIQLIIQHISFGGKFTEDAIRYILHSAAMIFKEEKNVVETTKQCTIIGDTHGQLYDFINLLCLSWRLC